MGRVFIEEAMIVTGINRTDLVGVCAYLVRSKQASSPADAIRRLEAGEFNKEDLEEQIIRSHQVNYQQPILEEEKDSLE